MKVENKWMLLVLLLALFFAVSCTTTYQTVALTSDDMDFLATKTVNDEDVKVKRSFFNMVKSWFVKDTRSIARTLQYFVSDKVVYSWEGDESSEKRNYTVTQDGKLIRSDAYKDKVFIIYKETLGILCEEPVIRDGKTVLTVDFNNIIVEFTEAEDGLFHLSSPTIEVEGYSYATTDNCTLMYELAVEKESEFDSNDATGKKMRN